MTISIGKSLGLKVQSPLKVEPASGSADSASYGEFVFRPCLPFWQPRCTAGSTSHDTLKLGLCVGGTSLAGDTRAH
jgi:hypothetical protein